MKHYFIDTNVVRYLTETSTTNPIENEQWLEPAEKFLNEVLLEIENDESSLRIPLEVFRELDIHSLNFSNSGNEMKSEYIEEYVELLNEISEDSSHTEYTTLVIHRLRYLSEYLRKYNNELERAGFEYRFDRGGETDARILCMAYDYEGVIVTGNIRDFLVYLLLGDEEEQKDNLYNIKNNQYIKLPVDIYNRIWNDPKFKEYKQEFLNALEAFTEVGEP